MVEAARNRNVNVIARLTFAWVCLYLVSVAAAADVPSAIGDRTAELKQFRALLNSEDQFTRWAAFEEGMDSDDALIRRMTQDLAFSSEDKTLQTMALKAWFKQRTSLVAELKLPAEATEEQVQLYKQYAPSVVFDRLSVKENNELEGRLVRDRSTTASLTPSGLIARSRRLELKLDLVDARTLAGTIAAEGGVALPVQVEVK